MARPRTKTEATKDIGGDYEGIDMPRESFAYAPDDDPGTWYLPTYDDHLLNHSIEAFVRCSQPRVSSNLERKHFPKAAANLADAFRARYPEAPIPPGLDKLLPPDYQRGETPAGKD